MTPSQIEKLAVYFIAGTQDLTADQQLPVLLEAAIKAGVTAFQFREKGPGSLEYRAGKYELALKLQEICRKHQVLFFINDDVPLALRLQADGVHVGQTDQPITEVIKDCQGKLLIGLSCHNPSEITQANQLAAVSYIGLGPVFTTNSKADALPALGTRTFTQLSQQSIKPIVAIGGLTVKNSQKLAKEPIAGLAVISAITQSVDLNQTVQALKA